MIVLVPFFGDRAKFRPLLDRWIEAKKKAAPDLVWFALGEEPETYDLPSARVSIDGFRDLVRPGQPFDVKGALVCAALLKFPEALLVLDADAFIARDPRSPLEAFASCPIAMPIDGGAVTHSRSDRLDAPFAGVVKCCAGVQFFGACPGRPRLVAGYRRAWEELAALPRPPWTPPLQHLREQHAWSIALRRRGGRTLPSSMNWAPQFYGESPVAFVNHWFGRTKWE